jgi:hypothetical protein
MPALMELFFQIEMLTGPRRTPAQLANQWNALVRLLLGVNTTADIGFTLPVPGGYPRVSTFVPKAPIVVAPSLLPSLLTLFCCFFRL